MTEHLLTLQARDKGTKLINEKGLFSLIEAAPDPHAAEKPAPAAANSQPKAAGSHPASQANGAAPKSDLAAASLAASGDQQHLSAA